jgi:hypothetical protein
MNIRVCNGPTAMIILMTVCYNAIVMIARPIDAFVVIPAHQCKIVSSSINIGMSAVNQPHTNISEDFVENDVVMGRTSTPYQWFTTTFMGLVVVSSIGMTLLLPQSASATYSAYAHREEDWQQRVAQNAIQVSNPKQLRSQLREIAPMNEERSRIFCPNGPSAAVSPLMENRCSDIKQATPSVFGRSDDVVGNSIPGFSQEWTSTVFSSNSADPGGLPEYGFTKSSRK